MQAWQLIVVGAKGPDEDTNFLLKWAFRVFGGAGEGDCRDWDAIAAWAQDVRLG